MTQGDAVCEVAQGDAVCEVLFQDRREYVPVGSVRAMDGARGASVEVFTAFL